jgi:acetyl esterase/lipase
MSVGATPTLGRRAFVVGTTIVGAGAVIAGCGLFDDGGPDRIRYGDASAQFGELYEPDAPTPWPVVVVIHGGSWQDGESLSIMDDACADLQGRGYAVWNIEYRRVGEVGGGFPGTLDDVGAAIDHLQVLAEDHPLSLDRVVLLGHSAGGTLALWAGGRSTLPPDAPGASPRIDPVAAVCLAGVPDLASCARQGFVDGACPQFLGGMPDERPGRYALASPIERLPIGLPQLVMHGREDLVVPVDQSERYAAAAEQAGDPVTLQLIDGADHFSIIEVDQPAWATVVDGLDRLRA